jgi:hypothetical protein
LPSFPTELPGIFDALLIINVTRRMIGLGEKAELTDAVGFDFVVDIPPRFGEYLDAALLRIQVLHPDCQFSRSCGAILVLAPDGHSEDQIRKTVLHAVYREKIYTETFGMRQALVAAVTAR